MVVILDESEMIGINRQVMSAYAAGCCVRAYDMMFGHTCCR